MKEKLITLKIYKDGCIHNNTDGDIPRSSSPS